MSQDFKLIGPPVPPGIHRGIWNGRIITFAQFNGRNRTFIRSDQSSIGWTAVTIEIDSDGTLLGVTPTASNFQCDRNADTQVLWSPIPDRYPSRT